MQNQPIDPSNEPQNDFWDLGDDDLDLDEAKEFSQSKQQPTDSASAQNAPAPPLDEILNDPDDEPALLKSPNQPPLLSQRPRRGDTGSKKLSRRQARRTGTKK